MKKVFAIAIREFLATVATKAFIFGMLSLPAIGGIVLLLVSLGLFESEAAKPEGTILVHDQTESAFVATGLESLYTEEAVNDRREIFGQQLSEPIEKLPLGNDATKEAAIDAVTNKLIPSVIIERLPADADLEQAKERLKDPDDDAFLIFAITDRSVQIPPSNEELDGLSDEARAARKADGAYEIYQGPDVRAQVVEDLNAKVRTLIINERIRREGFDPAQIEQLRRRPRAIARTVTDDGESKSQNELAQILPFFFFVLLLMSVMSGGQYLLMSTIEEKSTRVMEVLLSAISPTQLLLGKIIGQGAVGLIILLLYGGMGVIAADTFDLLALIPVRLLLWVVLYFFMAYAFFASLMAAAGSAVSDIREAQALVSPIMMLLMLPFFLWLPISQNPMGVLATSASFFPPLTPFIMVLRMCQPGVTIPLWQLIATTVAGLLGVAFMVYAAVKIFRVGVLMYGKPPSFWGLLKWIRYA